MRVDFFDNQREPPKKSVFHQGALAAARKLLLVSIQNTGETHLPSFKLLVAAASLLVTQAFATPTPVASYGFNNTFASSVGGAPDLVAVDPLGLGSFGTDTVFGVSQTVYNFAGNVAPSQQGGLLLNATGLLASASNYTMEIVFKFTQNAGAWRRILDVQNRQSDNGFYVDPSNNLDVYPVAGGAPFSNDAYHAVFLVNDNGLVSFYLDGSSQATVQTTVMNLNNPDNLFGFFLDNLVGAGQNEYSSGSVARINLYGTALTPDEIEEPGSVPEPGSLALIGLGVAGLAAGRRRKRA